MNSNVLFVQRRMPLYRIHLFEEMRKGLERKSIRLEIIHGSPCHKEVLRGDEGILPWAIIIPSRYFNIGSIQLVYQPVPPHLIKKQDLIIIPHENRLLSNYSLLFQRPSGSVRIAFFGHGANFQEKRPGTYRGKLKSLTARKADWWFAYTSLSVKKILEKGFPENRITCVNNALDVTELAEFKKSIAPDELYALKTVLGLKGNNIGIFIGSLYQDKRLELLFSAVDKLHQRLSDFELIIIGDGPLREKVRTFVQTRQWICWVGKKHGREKVLHMALGKVIINTGLVGLNILDSFALGIPMITTDCGIHSPEIAYLESGRNGIMTPDNLGDYVTAVEELLKNDQKREQMASACMEDSRKYTLEKMVENFTHGILQALQHEPLRK
jgi:L-malate glycosyltransferase